MTTEKVSRRVLINKAIQDNDLTLDPGCLDFGLFQSFVVAIANYLDELDDFTESLGEGRLFTGNLFVYSVQFFKTNKDYFCAVVGDDEDPLNTITKKRCRTMVIAIKDFLDMKQAKKTVLNDSLKHTREEVDLLMGKLGEKLEKVEKLERCLTELN